ncbi:hypothetical protein [Agilicoccus flavus]|uniref:hypothetical protein n=1 Tax=Agilicoccus flavus TaxID=2775968 RepID=UPI001CF67A00|nr:hypothetical protein [Agilicoccus flavus]
MITLSAILGGRRRSATSERRVSRLSRASDGSRRRTFRPALMTPMAWSRRDENEGEPLGAGVEDRLEAMPASTAADVDDACDTSFGAPSASTTPHRH